MIREPVTSIVTVMYSRRGEVGSIWIWERFHVHILIVFGVICNVFRLMYGVQNFLAVWSKLSSKREKQKEDLLALYIRQRCSYSKRIFLCYHQILLLEERRHRRFCLFRQHHLRHPKTSTHFAVHLDNQSLSDRCSIPRQAIGVDFSPLLLLCCPLYRKTVRHHPRPCL